MTVAGAWFVRTLVLLALAVPAIEAAAAAPSASQAAAIDRVFDDIGTSTQPGCALAIFESGTIGFERGYGLADVVRRTPITHGTVFNTGSISKQFTAYAILLLARQGKLRIDGRAADYLPGMRNLGDVTIAELLHHLGGLRDYLDLALLASRRYDRPFTKAEALALIDRQPEPNAPPGTRYEYSNSGYFLLGAIVEQVSGQSLASFSAREIFAPLGMTGASIVDRYPARIAALARGYAPARAGFAIDEPVWEQTGDGQVHMTVVDLARWDAHLDRGGSLVQQLLQPGMTRSGTAIRYAAGIRLERFRGYEAISHSGDWGGYAGHFLRLPGRFSIAVLCNRSDGDPGGRAERVADILLGTNRAAAMLPDFALGLKPGLSTVATGRYRNSRTGRAFRIENSRNGPILKDIEGVSRIDQPRPGLFRAGSGASVRYFTFHRSPEGGVPHAILPSGPIEDRFERVPDWRPGRELAGRCGAFSSVEAGFSARLTRGRGGFALTIAAERIRLAPVTAWEFEGMHPRAGRILVNLDPAKPDRFWLSSLSAQRLAFDRFGAERRCDRAARISPTMFDL